MHAQTNFKVSCMLLLTFNQLDIINVTILKSTNAVIYMSHAISNVCMQ